MEQPGTTRQEEMFSHIEALQPSGKTQAEFCGDRQISYHIFHYWLAKRSRRSAGPQSGLFTSIHLSTQRAKPGFIELIFPDGRRLVSNQAVEAGFLRSLLV